MDKGAVVCRHNGIFSAIKNDLILFAGKTSSMRDQRTGHASPHRVCDLLRMELGAPSIGKHPVHCAMSPTLWYFLADMFYSLFFFRVWFPWISVWLLAENECLYLPHFSCLLLKVSVLSFPLRWALKTHSLMKLWGWKHSVELKKTSKF